MSRAPAIGLVAALGVAGVLAVTSVDADSKGEQHVSNRVVEAINLACATYGHCAELWSKARCETGGTFDPGSRNPAPVGGEHAAGLYQFLPSTWRTTPYRMFSPYNPNAAALAAGWMHQQGRGGEWACH